MLLQTFLTFHSHRRLSPPASRQPTSFLIPKKTTVSSLNNSHSVALTLFWETGSPAHQIYHTPLAWTLTLSTLFEPTDLQRMPYPLPSTQSPCTWRIRTATSYMRILFVVDSSSTFNTISPMKQTRKLNTLGLTTTLCNWIFNLLTSRLAVTPAYKLCPLTYVKVQDKTLVVSSKN